MTSTYIGKFSENGNNKFSQSSKGGGNNNTVPESYGEFYIVNNFRPTALVFNAWTKIEAGNLDPPPPAQYSYVGGKNLSWLYDATTKRLEYIGENTGTFRITFSLSAAIQSGADIPIYFSIRKNGENSGDLVNKMIMPAELISGASKFRPCSNTVLFDFEPGDYIEPVLKNNTDSTSVIVNFANFNVSAVGAGEETGLVSVVDQNNMPWIDENGNLIVAPYSSPTSRRKAQKALYSKASPRAMMTTGVQIYEFPNSLPSLTSLLPWSDEDAPGHIVQNSSLSQLIDVIAPNMSYSDAFNLTLSAVSGITGTPTPLWALYKITKNPNGFTVDINTSFTVVSDGTGGILTVAITPPVATTFDDADNPKPLTFEIVETSKVGGDRKHGVWLVQ